MNITLHFFGRRFLHIVVKDVVYLTMFLWKRRFHYCNVQCRYDA